MALSEILLSGWASAPGDAQAQEAYGQVTSALEGNLALRSRTIDKYLQGSYRNRTHIRADSDVDVVAELQSTFSYNIDSLTASEKAYFDKSFPDSQYRFHDFKRDVLFALVEHFGESSVTEGNKCFKVAGNQKRSDADVLACLEHRKYTQFTAQKRAYIPGIKFYTKDESRIINWPKEHYKKGAAKNQATDSTFKGLVRIFKHIRKLLVEVGGFDETRAPSYFIECLLYNVPNQYFGAAYSTCLNGALSFLQRASLSSFMCVNEIDTLFGEDNVWNVADAKAFIDSVITVNQAARS
jgi:hypothetical protein